MAIRYKNPQTGEYEVIKIPVMKGDQGHAGIHVGTDVPPTTDVKLWFDPSDTDNDVDLANRLDTTLTACYDYMGNDRGSIKAAADANVDWLLGEINTAHYDGQHITATDTIEGRSKSAILKGQTLVNVKPKTSLSKWGTSSYDSDSGICTLNGSNSGIRFNIDLLKTSTKYLVIFDIVELPTFAVESDAPIKLTLGHNSYNYLNINRNELKVGTLRKIVTTNNEFTEHMCIGNRGEFSTPIKLRFNIIEYQEGMENWDIPYFEGMQSVKMPTLKAIGKNLLPPVRNKWYPCRFKQGTAFKLSTKDSVPSNGGNVVFKDINGTSIWFGIDRGNTTSTKVLPCDMYYISNSLGTGVEHQLEIGTQVTSYEPYKSNILTVNEEVTLRGIGNVKDELDCLTKKITESIEEVAFDGSDDEKWTIQTDYVSEKYIMFGLELAANGRVIGANPALSDKWMIGDISTEQSQSQICVFRHQGWITQLRVVIEKEKLANADVLAFRDYISKNNFKVAYAKESIVKTVDLSGHHVYSYKETTHYTCSSEDSLIPTLSIDVPTNLSALVTKQRQQIRTLEEENQILSDELQLAIASSEENDNELLAQSFELDFRLMEVECALDLPMAATFRLGGKAMAMTPYEMAKKLILADNYDRADMEHKLDVYVSKKRMTEAERQELIQLMDEKEGVITIDPVEPEVEESVIEHEAVTIPLH